MPSAHGTLSNKARLGPVHFRVREVARTVPLWRDIVGLTVTGEKEGALELGVPGRTLVCLHGGASGPVQDKHVGLFHAALSFPSRLELARVAQRLRDARHPHGAQDHLVSESIYLSDEDGNGIELYVPTPERADIAIVEGRPRFVTRDGKVHSGLEALDLNLLLGEIGEHGKGNGLVPGEIRVGHIHMRSNTPEEAIAFYADTLGFAPHIASAEFGMFDCGTPANPHMIAFNIWGGRSLPVASSESAGLLAFTIELPQTDLDDVSGRLGSAGFWEGAMLACSDPDRNRVLLTIGAH
jgi:catechol 2,3-dioxygenase